MAKFDDWGAILLDRGFGHNGAGTASSEARKPNPALRYFCISGAGWLLEIFLPTRYLRIHAGKSPGCYRVLRYPVSNPATPKNAFYEHEPALDKEHPEGEVTKMLKKI